MALPLVLLLAILLLLAVAAVALLATSTRQKKLAARVGSVAVRGQPVKPLSGPTILVRRREKENLRRALAFLKVPVDLPLANILPPVVVVGIGVSIGAAAWALTLAVASSALAMVAGILIALVAIRGIFSWELDMYRAKLVSQLPDTVQLVVSASRAGLPVAEAFRTIAQEMRSPTRDEFVLVDRAMAIGETPDQALLALYRRTGVPEYAIFAVTIGVQSRSGGRLAETMQNLADTVRERLAIVSRAKALASESKLSAFIMCALPFLSGGWMTIMAPDKMAVLIHEPRGIRLMVVAIVTMVLGILTMRHLIGGVADE